MQRIPFADRLCERAMEIESRLVVGIDPTISRLPSELRKRSPEVALTAFSEGVLEAVAPVALAVKPNAAFYEQHGWKGMRALHRCLERSQELGIPVILDAKRGDIGSTAEAYASAYLGDDPETLGPHVDALTVNPYLGTDSLEPFIRKARAGNRGLFVLARTSNPGGGEFQQRMTDDESLWLAVARKAREWGEGMVGKHGYGPIGLVAGVTYPEDLQVIREAAPESILLVPGVGAQGGDVQAIAAAFDGRGLGAVIPSSRSIIYATPEGDESWTDAVARAAVTTRDAIEEALRAAAP